MNVSGIDFKFRNSYVSLFNSNSDGGIIVATAVVVAVVVAVISNNSAVMLLLFKIHIYLLNIYGKFAFKEYYRFINFQYC